MLLLANRSGPGIVRPSVHQVAFALKTLGYICQIRRINVIRT